jgi:2-C-methyl-D-erythritol 2,4-cyclodiphosphate synthase
MSGKIGFGYDIHRLVEGRKLFLGGIEVPYIKGLLGHSDGDVLLHAICDAILGAIAAGDIGEHFPDNNPRFQDIASSTLLDYVKGLLRQKGFKISHLDTVVIAQEPKLTLFKKQIHQKIATLLELADSQVNIKAKTNEGLGELGKKEAIAAYAVVLINKGD